MNKYIKIFLFSLLVVIFIIVIFKEKVNESSKIESPLKIQFFDKDPNEKWDISKVDIIENCGEYYLVVNIEEETSERNSIWLVKISSNAKLEWKRKLPIINYFASFAYGDYLVILGDDDYVLDTLGNELLIINKKGKIKGYRLDEVYSNLTFDDYKIFPLSSEKYLLFLNYFYKTGTIYTCPIKIDFHYFKNNIEMIQEENNYLPKSEYHGINEDEEGNILFIDNLILTIYDKYGCYEWKIPLLVKHNKDGQISVYLKSNIESQNDTEKVKFIEIFYSPLKEETYGMLIPVKKLYALKNPYYVDCIFMDLEGKIYTIYANNEKSLIFLRKFDNKGKLILAKKYKIENNKDTYPVENYQILKYKDYLVIYGYSYQKIYVLILDKEGNIKKSINIKSTEGKEIIKAKIFGNNLIIVSKNKDQSKNELFFTLTSVRKLDQ